MVTRAQHTPSVLVDPESEGVTEWWLTSNERVISYHLFYIWQSKSCCGPNSQTIDYRLFPSLLTRHINNWNDAETVHTRIWSKWNFHGPNKYSWDRFFWSFTLFDFNAHQTFWESDVCYRVHSYEFVLHIIWYVDYIYIYIIWHISI